MVADDPDSFADLDGHDTRPAGRCLFCRIFKWFGGGLKSPGSVPLPPGNPELGTLWNAGVGIYNFAAKLGYVLSGSSRALNVQFPTFRPMNDSDARDMNSLQLALLLVPDVGEEVAAEDLTYLYEKVGSEGQHLKYGITKNPATRYTAEELAGGRLKILAKGSRRMMLSLERQLHSTLPIGSEERQLYYILKQTLNGLKAPPY